MSHDDTSEHHDEENAAQEGSGFRCAADRRQDRGRKQKPCRWHGRARCAGQGISSDVSVPLAHALYV